MPLVNDCLTQPSPKALQQNLETVKRRQQCRLHLVPMSRFTVYCVAHQHSMTCHHRDSFPDFSPPLVSHGYQEWVEVGESVNLMTCHAMLVRRTTYCTP